MSKEESAQGRLGGMIESLGREMLGLDVLQEIREADLHAERNHFEHRKRDGLAATFYIADEAAVDAEVVGHAELRQVTLAPEFTQTCTKATADVARKAICLTRSVGG